MPRHPAVVAQRLTKRYGHVTALDHLDLTIDAGEIYSLIGSNGSGKTTLARILTGGLRASAGHFQVLGGKRDRADRRRVGYMPQDFALYGDLSIKGNLRYFASLYGVHRRKQRIAEVAELVQLDHRMDDLVRNLSGGMKRRVSLAAAMLPEPNLLILDEPTVGVDPVLRAELWETFRARTQDGHSVLITTHYLDEAQRSHRVGLLHGGRLLTEGAPREVLGKTGTSNLEDAFHHILQEDKAQSQRTKRAPIDRGGRDPRRLPHAKTRLKQGPKHPPEGGWQ